MLWCLLITLCLQYRPWHGSVAKETTCLYVHMDVHCTTTFLQTQLVVLVGRGTRAGCTGTEPKAHTWCRVARPRLLPVACALQHIMVPILVHEDVHVHLATTD
jgi:hypothetical protein